MGIITVSNFNGEVLFHGDEKDYYPPLDGINVCCWDITVKGDIPCSKMDPVLKKKYLDSRRGYGSLFFIGTEVELDGYMDDLMKAGLKIIGTKKSNN